MRNIDRFAYVRDYYGLPWVKRGVSVTIDGKPGTVTDATHYLFVKLDGEKHARPYHPDDVKPRESEENSISNAVQPRKEAP